MGNSLLTSIVLQACMYNLPPLFPLHSGKGGYLGRFSNQVVLYPLPAVPTYCIVDAYECPSLYPCLAIREACNNII